MAKSLMHKTIYSGNDAWLAVLEDRNTPTQLLGSSPVQRMMSRKMRTKLPLKPSQLDQQVVQDMAERVVESQAAHRAFTAREQEVILSIF